MSANVGQQSRTVLHTRFPYPVCTCWHYMAFFGKRLSFQTPLSLSPVLDLRSVSVCVGGGRGGDGAEIKPCPNPLSTCVTAAICVTAMTEHLTRSPLRHQRFVLAHRLWGSHSSRSVKWLISLYQEAELLFSSPCHFCSVWDPRGWCCLYLGLVFPSQLT